MDPLWSTTRLMFMASPTASGTTCSTVAGYCEPDESVSVTANWDTSRPPGVEPAWSAIFVYGVTCGYAELSTCDTNGVSGLSGSDEAVAGWLDTVGCCTVVGVWTLPESASEASSPKASATPDPIARLPNRNFSCRLKIRPPQCPDKAPIWPNAHLGGKCRESRKRNLAGRRKRRATARPQGCGTIERTRGVHAHRRIRPKRKGASP